MTEGGKQMGTVEVPLDPKTHYYWRVRKTQAPGAPSICWRQPLDFTTGDKTPTAISPSRDTVEPWALEFKWTEVPGATSYSIQVATDKTFSNSSLIFPPVDAVQTPWKLSVKVKSHLFSQVRANITSSGGQPTSGAWSKAVSFSTKMPKVVLLWECPDFCVRAAVFMKGDLHAARQGHEANGS